MQNNIIFEGPLVKVKVKADKECYFQLTPTQLMYYRRRKTLGGKEKEKIEKNKIKTIPLSELTVINGGGTGDPKNPFAFSLQTAKESFVVAAASVEARAEWVHFLTRSIARIHMEKGKVGGGLTGLNVDTSKLSSDPLLQSRSSKFFAEDEIAKNIQTGTIDSAATLRRLSHSPSVSVQNSHYSSSGSRENSRFGGENLAPVWTKDSSSKECSKCKTAFSLFTRRHHCRSCGLLFCNSCTRRKWILPNISSSASRVCEKCYIELQRQQAQKSARLDRLLLQDK